MVMGLLITASEGHACTHFALRRFREYHVSGTKTPLLAMPELYHPLFDYKIVSFTIATFNEYFDQ